MLKPGIAIAAAAGLAAVVAGGAGYWLASRAPAEPATVIVLPAPMAPPTVAATAPPRPAPSAAPVAVSPQPAKRAAKKTEKRPVAVRRSPDATSGKVTETQREPARDVAAEVPHTPAPAPVVVTAVEAPKPAPPPPPAPVTPPAPVRTARTVTIPAGTLITVRLNQELSSERHTEGDVFSASLDQPLVIDGLVIAERGSRQQGRVLASERAGRVKGRASIQLGLVRLATADGQNVELQTDPFTQVAERSVKKDVARAGVVSAIGAAIGAIAGGGKGAAIGAGVGGAAGAGTVLATRGQDAELRAETRISFRLTRPVTLTEKLN